MDARNRMTVPRYAVIGHPIAHSLSPRLHALFGEQIGVALEYTAIDAAPDDFPGSLRAFFAAGGRGANVTLPHKAAAFALADVHTPAAQRLAVANVLTVLPDGRIEADSNDGAGMLRDFERLGIDPRGCRALLLGAGGAARAAAYALVDSGIAALTIANRTGARAIALATALAMPARVAALPWDGLSFATDLDLVVNATSAGVRHESFDLPSPLVRAETFAYDLSYGPAAVPFLDWAHRAGSIRAFDGLGMLVETAAASFERWHGVHPDTASALRKLRTGSDDGGDSGRPNH